MVLCERVSHVADRADSESEQICFNMRCVTLKVPMQRAVIARSHEAITRPRKMVHADVFIASCRQPLDRIKKQLKFLGFRRQIFFETSLLMLQHRHMRVAEHRQAIRIQLEYEVESLLKRRPSLLRQTIDEIGIDALESQGTGIIEELAGVPVWLDSADC